MVAICTRCFWKIKPMRNFRERLIETSFFEEFYPFSLSPLSDNTYLPCVFVYTRTSCVLKKRKRQISFFFYFFLLEFVSS